MDWRIKASIQKVLSHTKLGDQLNHIPAAIRKNYHKNVVIYQFHECIRKYEHTNLDLSKPCNALEIGTGYSLISSLTLFLLGFNKIVTVDIDYDLKYSAFSKQIQFFNSDFYIDQFTDKGVRSKEEIKQLMDSIQELKSIEEVLSFCGIKYIAPYTFEDINLEENSFDYICSQVVFEHIPPEILEDLIKNCKVWLNKGSHMVHTVNFIDHFANPGFFKDKGISEYNFLQFSDDYWKFWAGNPIAYTNRLSYVFYEELLDKYKFEKFEFIGENYRNPVPLDHSKIHKDVLNKYNSSPDLKELTKYQRGTFIVQN